MVTPFPTSKKSVFPLFNKLLNEARSAAADKKVEQFPKCPATAPVLFSSNIEIRRPPSIQPNTNKMEKADIEESQRNTTSPNKPGALHSVRMSGNDEDKIKPITLQDPPKAKLKRQLSVETADRSEAQRVRKRQLIESPQDRFKDNNSSWSDEVDGSMRPLSETRIPVPRQIDREKTHAIAVCETASVEIPTTKTLESGRTVSGNMLTKQPGSTPYQTGSSCYQTGSILQTPATCCDTRSLAYMEQPILSPTHFNLNEIVQTSPFISTTPKVHKSQEKNIFIFPEQTTPRKVSPYSLTKEQASPNTSATTDSQIRYSQSTYRQSVADQQTEAYLMERCKTPRGDELSNNRSIHFPPYVSPKGFHWPNTPSINQQAPVSPRFASSESQQYSVKVDTTVPPTNRYEGSEDDYARLCLLNREYTRAMKTYGYLKEQDLRRPRDINDVIRRDMYKTQRSAEERSPNEKALRETREDVQNRYERSISAPTYSPQQLRYIIQKSNQLARERKQAFSDENDQDTMDKDTRRESWQNDYRRRLFMKDDPYTSYYPEARRSLFDQDTHPTTGATEIPEEVLEFLHSRNFHPEELQNLKDILRRGGSESASYMRSASVQFEGQEEHLRPHLPDSEFLKKSPNERFDSELRPRQFGSTQRERQLGDINIRLSCGSIKEKGKQAQDIDNESKECKCVRLENEIRAMAMDAYSKIRRLDTSVESFNQFQTELNETNTIVTNSMKLLRTIKCLCKHGRTVEEIYNGSVVFRINCPDVDALLDLWNMYKSGSLQRMMQDAFVSEELKEKYECDDINLKVSISREEYINCKHELEASIRKNFFSPSQKSPCTPTHARSRSEPASVSKQANLLPHLKSSLSPFRERICSDSSVELSPRRAFQEINTRDIPMQPLSPSKKYIPDNVFISDDPPRSPLAPISPLTSPRRKSFGTKLQFQQQENVEQGPDVTSPRSGTPV